MCTALLKPISSMCLVTELDLPHIRLTFEAFYELISSLNRLSMALKRKSWVERTAQHDLQDLADKGIVVATVGRQRCQELFGSPMWSEQMVTQ